MTLEERIESALRDSWPTAPIGGGERTIDVSALLSDLARAVVVVLPAADVSDAQILDSLATARQSGDWRDDIWDAEALTPAVRALLDAQAAAHATEQTLGGQALLAMDAEVEALRAEVERLRNNEIDALMKAHAFRAERNSAQDGLARRLSQWDDVLAAERAAHDAEVEALRAEIRSLTLNLLAPPYGDAIARAEAAEADRDAYRARIDAVRALCEPWLTDLSPTSMPRPPGGVQLAGLIRAALDGA